MGVGAMARTGDEPHDRADYVEATRDEKHAPTEQLESILVEAPSFLGVRGGRAEDDRDGAGWRADHAQSIEDDRSTIGRGRDPYNYYTARSSVHTGSTQAVILPHMRCRLFGLVCLLLCWAAGSLAIRAQAPTAQISGTVVDPVGHILPGVAVTLESVPGGPPTVDAPATSVVASTITSGDRTV